MPIESKVRAIDRSLSYARRVNQSIHREKNSFESQEEIIRRHDIEWHKKFTLSFACLIFFFIGAPLGSIIRKGGLGTPVVISVVFFIIYYIISMIGERSAREGVMDPWYGMWLSSFLLLPLGVLLTWKAVTDSEILNSDLYINFFRKFGLYKEKQEKKEVKQENIIA
jgi:lipopolysaccharide export system permease protein